MQMMYIVSFLTMLFVLLLTQGRNDAEMVENDSTAVASAMILWHSAATKKCAAAPCPGGIVDVFSSLPPAVQAGPAFATTATSPKYISRYDNVNKVLVTYMPSSSAAIRASVSFGTVNAALADIAAKRGESSQVGHWEAPLNRVVFGVTNAGSVRFKTLANPFMGGIIPNGSPVMLGAP